MSYSPPNYTDGVPIKISEKYKPPPAIHLPTKIIQQLGKTEVPVAFEEYNFDLEQKILSKTSEWMQWRAREKLERENRIQERERLRLKQLEDEQKQKLNQVSYPSSDEEEEEEATTTQIDIPRDKPFSPTDFNTILMPEVVDPGSRAKVHRRYASNSSNKIDFSLFESEKSPFDHLEMKSMNEMEVLAQVLAVESEGSTTTTNNLERDNSSESESSDHQKDNNNVASIPIQQPQFQQTYVPQPFYGGQYYSYGASPVTASGFQPVNHHNQFLYPQNYAVNYQYNPATLNNNTIVNGNTETTRTVPSIFQELNDELNNSERRRIRNSSQSSPKEVVIEEDKSSPEEDGFSKLSIKTQHLATQMGFSKDLVIRTVSRVGDNDKKVVDHLIPLSELTQMGFDEAMVSEALIKFDNNRERALDYLIS